MNFTNIDKILKALEASAQSVSYDIDNDGDYLALVALVTDLEEANRSATKMERMRITVLLSIVSDRAKISNFALIEALIA